MFTLLHNAFAGAEAGSRSKKVVPDLINKIRDDFHRGTTQIMLCITLMDIGMTRGQYFLSCNSCC